MDDIKPKRRRGGPQPGSGRPKGKLNKSTLEKLAVLKEYKQKIMHQANKIFQTQSALAFGSYMIYLVEHYEDAEGKVRERKVLVEDPEIIENILNDPDMVQGDNYYVVTVIPPDQKVLSDMLDRAFGKASIMTEDKDGNQKPVEGIIQL